MFSWILHTFVLFWPNAHESNAVFCQVYVPDFALYRNLSFIFLLLPMGGLGIVVGISTVYSLDGPAIESRWRARFSAPVQTSSGAHPASCTLGTGSFPGVKSGQGVTLVLTPF